MKTYKNQYSKLCDYELILQAHLETRKGKSSTGTKKEIKSFETNLKESINEILRELIAQTYKPGKFRFKMVFEPKTRIISYLSLQG